MGLKLRDLIPLPDPGEQPQSNQRGIETQEDEEFETKEDAGLNRTSVGLKPMRNRRLLAWKAASIEPAWD